MSSSPIPAVSACRERSVRGAKGQIKSHGEAHGFFHPMQLITSSFLNNKSYVQSKAMSCNEWGMLRGGGQRGWSVLSKATRMGQRQTGLSGPSYRCGPSDRAGVGAGAADLEPGSGGPRWTRPVRRRPDRVGQRAAGRADRSRTTASTETGRTRARSPDWLPGRRCGAGSRRKASPAVRTGPAALRTLCREGR
ncbi:MAG: hypothetical protein QOD01_2299 [Actinomycetota bacterium]|nr:hypothetical protein [Actinomycetota bacterium]